MARRDPEDRKDKKKPDVEKKKDANEQDQEQEQQTEKQKEPEHVRAQNQIGNAALAAMMNTGPGGRGGGGVDVEMAKKKADMEKEGQGFGGEDDDADPIAALDGDLSESWNPTTTHPTDRLAFVEAMPEDELPAEDDAFVEAIRAVRDLPRSTSASSIEPLLQPSPEVLTISTQAWGRAVGRFMGTSLHERAWARLIARPGPLLQDPHGRVLLLRARTAALAANALVSSPALQRGDVPTAALVCFALELEARDWRVRAGRIALGDNTARALARDTLQMVIGEGEGTVRPRQFDANGHGTLSRALRTLWASDDPRSLVPQVDDAAVPDEEDDDPLGVDAVLSEFTGGAPDPREGVYRTFLQAADKIANAVYLARVRLAGVGAAVADVAHLWSSGAPENSLLDGMSDFDAKTGEIINLLKDVARAANKRNVALRTLRAWLDKAAEKLIIAQEEAIATLACIIAGVLPGEPRVPEPPDRELDPLDEAWGDGTPEDAIPWLRSLPPSLDRDVTIAFTTLATAWDTADLGDQFAALRARASDQIGLADALGVVVGAIRLAEGRYDDAIEIGRARLGAALARRNGVVAAEAALLEVDALVGVGRVDEAAARRVRAGAQVWQLGTRGGLTLLARWRPPEA